MRAVEGEVREWRSIASRAINGKAFILMLQDYKKMRIAMNGGNLRRYNNVCGSNARYRAGYWFLDDLPLSRI